MGLQQSRLSRRGVLRAAGVCLGLPWLETLATANDQAKPIPQNRLVYLYVPNGVNVPQWQVSGAGGDYELSPTLAPLAPFRNELTIIDGLNHENATPGPDGGGDHSRATAVYLTGVRPKKTGGSDIRNGVSIDQLIARQVGGATRLPSLEISTDGPRFTGRCDSGYSCAYQFNLSWASSTRPVPAEQNPRSAFERLFGAGDQDNEHRRQLRKSVLDFVLDDTHSLANRISSSDKDKLDQFLTSIREVEQRIERAERAPVSIPDSARPDGIPETYQEHIRTMLELIALAFQSDATRMITFTLSYDGSNRAFPEIGIPEAHHQLSHHRGDADKLEKIARIDRFYVEQFAWFLDRLQATSEDNRNLLDNSMVLYGSCISDGDQHLHSDLPLVLAGRGRGTLQPGKRLTFDSTTPMCNLHLALAERMGLTLDQFGDSTDTLSGI